MIKISREHDEHGRIISLLIESLDNPSGGGAPYAGKLKEFIDGYLLGHIEFEENELFPTLLEVGSQKEKKLVKELKQEHIQLLNDIKQFNDLFSSLDYQLKKTVRIKEAHWYSKKIIYTVRQHARKEDRELLPIIVKHKNAFT